MGRRLLRFGAAAAALLLLASGCSGATVEESATPTPTHVAQVGEPALPQVAGYEYHDVVGADREDLDEVRAEMAAANTELPGAFSGMAAHQVTGPTGAEFLVMQIQVGPALASDPEAMEAIAMMLTGAIAAEFESVRIATKGGVEVAQGVGEDIAGCTWTQRDLLFVVLGDNEDEVNTYTEALITACRDL